jgi:hypothetical protein
LGEDLNREHVVVTIDDEARQEVGFAENDPIGIRVADDGFAIANSRSNSLAQQSRKIRDRLAGNEANSDLRGAGIERYTKRLAAMVCDCDESREQRLSPSGDSRRLRQSFET